VFNSQKLRQPNYGARRRLTFTIVYSVPVNPSGVGLASMTEPATELGGWCRTEVSPTGTRVTAWLPIMIDR
jgi:signal transduction histidine kinase